MISAEVIDALVASGCSPEQIAAVVKADLIAENSVIEAKREKDRKRKKAARDAAKLAALAECPEMSTDILGNPRNAEESADGAETVSLSPIQKPNSARGCRLPEDWTLTGPDLAFALSKGHSEADIAEIFEKFTNYWWSATGAKATKRDWHKAWKVWVLNTRPRSRAGPLSAKPLTEHQRKQQETKDILNDLANFAAGSGGSSEPNPGILRHDTGG